MVLPDNVDSYAAADNQSCSSLDSKIHDIVNGLKAESELPLCSSMLLTPMDGFPFTLRPDCVMLPPLGALTAS